MKEEGLTIEFGLPIYKHKAADKALTKVLFILPHQSGGLVAVEGYKTTKKLNTQLVIDIFAVQHYRSNEA